MIVLRQCRLLDGRDDADDGEGVFGASRGDRATKEPLPDRLSVRPVSLREILVVPCLLVCQGECGLTRAAHLACARGNMTSGVSAGEVAYGKRSDTASL
jgi:hypothetical protein